MPKMGDENRKFGVPTIRYDIKKPEQQSVADPNVWNKFYLELCWWDHCNITTIPQIICLIWGRELRFWSSSPKELDLWNFY